MPNAEILDVVPLWFLLLATFALVLASLEIGFRLGKWRHERSDQEKETPVGAMVGATIGLLGFMLAFTFGMAGARFDDRRKAVLDEVNAIGTTYLRAEMLPEPQRSETRKLLKEYVDVRLEPVQSGRLEEAIRRSEELHGRLWSQAVAVGEKQPNSIIVGLYIQSLNEMIDLHTTRVTAGLRSRIPTVLWAVLYAITFSGMAAMGYHAGISGTSRSLAALGLALTFSAVISLIADLDRPQEGTLKVSQQGMIDLQKSMRNEKGP